MKVKCILLATCAALIASSTQAALTLTLEQSGPDVVLTGSGSANLTDLTFLGSATASNGGIAPNRGIFVTGSGNLDSYSGITTILFGSGSTTLASSTTGDVLAIDETLLGVPAGYVSGTMLGSSTATFDNTTLAALGATPGTYTWNWGSGPNADSATLTVVPEPGTYAALCGLTALGLVMLRRRKAA